MIVKDTIVDRRRFIRGTGGLVAGGMAGVAGCTTGPQGSAEDTPASSNEQQDGEQGSGERGGDRATEQKQDLPTVVHGVTKGGTTGVLINVVKDQGFDVENGIVVEPKAFVSPPKVQKQIVYNDDIPTGYMGSIVATRLHAQKKRPQLVGPYMLYHMYVLTTPESDIDSPADLAGARISWASKSADAWLKFNVILEMDHGIAPEELQFFQVAPAASVSLLAKGELDAILLQEPLVSKVIVEQGFEVVYSPRDAWNEMTGTPMTTVMVAWDGGWYENNESKGEKLARTIRDGQGYIQADVASVIDKYRDVYGLTTDEQVALAQERLGELYPAEWSDEIFDAEFDIAKRAQGIGLIDVEPTRDIFNKVL